MSIKNYLSTTVQHLNQGLHFMKNAVNNYIIKVIIIFLLPFLKTFLEHCVLTTSQIDDTKKSTAESIKAESVLQEVS